MIDKTQHAHYLHCTNCIDELPGGVSPQEYTRQESYIEGDAIVLWCLRHHHLIAKFSIKNPPKMACGVCGED